MNYSVYKIDKTIYFLSKENPDTKFLSFYPGDTWDLKSSFSNQDSFDKYNEDNEKINALTFEEQTIDFNFLKESSSKFIDIKKKLIFLNFIIF